MFSTIWGLIPTNLKIGLGVGLTLIVSVIGGIYTYQSNKIDSLEKSLTTCKTERMFEKSIYESEMVKAKETITNQNKEIKEFKLDSTTYANTIKQKESELLSVNINTQKTLEAELSKDSSSDNQLKIINNMLKEFSNE